MIPLPVAAGVALWTTFSTIGADQIAPFVDLLVIGLIGAGLVLILPRSITNTSGLGLLDSMIHAVIVIITVLAACILALDNHASDTTVATILGAAIGYAAGRSGTRASSRRDDELR